MEKLDFINAYFDDLADKISFAEDLYERGRRDEALILCCSYIAGLGTHLYSPSKHDRANFSRCLVEHGDQEILCLVHSRALLDYVRGKGAKCAKQAALAVALQPCLPSNPPEFLDHAQLVQLVAKHNPAALDALEEAWMLGTVASIVYTRLRNPTAHELRAPGFISFDEAKYRGERVHDIDFPIVVASLKQASERARQISVSTGLWFGQQPSIPNRR